MIHTENIFNPSTLMRHTGNIVYSHTLPFSQEKKFGVNPNPIFHKAVETIRNLKIQLHKKESELQIKSSEISNLEAQLEDKGNKVSNLEAQLEDKGNKVSNLEAQLEDKGNKVSNLEQKQKILKLALIIMLFFGVATAIYVYKNRPASIEPSRVEQIIPPKIPEPIKIKPKKGKKR